MQAEKRRGRPSASKRAMAGAAIAAPKAAAAWGPTGKSLSMSLTAHRPAVLSKAMASAGMGWAPPKPPRASARARPSGLTHAKRREDSRLLVKNAQTNAVAARRSSASASALAGLNAEVWGARSRAFLLARDSRRPAPSRPEPPAAASWLGKPGRLCAWEKRAGEGGGSARAKRVSRARRPERPPDPKPDVPPKAMLFMSLR